MEDFISRLIEYYGYDLDTIKKLTVEEFITLQLEEKKTLENRTKMLMEVLNIK